MSSEWVKHKTADDAQERPILETFVGYNLKRAYVVIYDDYSATLGRDGFAPRVFSALATIVQYPNISQSAVARHLGVERYGLVAIVDELEKRQLVVRTSVPGDRRVQALVATDAGIAAFRAACAEVQSHEDRVLADLSTQEQQTLIHLLQKIRKPEEPR